MCPDWESNWRPLDLQPALNPLSYTSQSKLWILKRVILCATFFKLFGHKIFLREMHINISQGLRVPEQFWKHCLIFIIWLKSDLAFSFTYFCLLVQDPVPFYPSTGFKSECIWSGKCGAWQSALGASVTLKRHFYPLLPLCWCFRSKTEPESARQTSIYPSEKPNPVSPWKYSAVGFIPISVFSVSVVANAMTCSIQKGRNLRSPTPRF